MVAAISVRVYTGTDAATESGEVIGIDLISADNALNSLDNRTDFPVLVGTNSYSKWMRLKVDTAPDNAVSNIVWWSTATPVEGVFVRALTGLSTGLTPSTDALASLGDDIDFYSATVDIPLAWDDAVLINADDLTDFLILQLQPTASANGGNVDTTLFWSYDET